MGNNENQLSYVVKTITDHRIKGGFDEYFVTWKDKKLESSWEPVGNFNDFNVINMFWKNRKPETGEGDVVSPNRVSRVADEAINRSGLINGAIRDPCLAEDGNLADNKFYNS